MQLRKSFALLAAALVGFGASSAGAQSVQSVTITKPDSGKVVGIDSLFVVTVTVQDIVSSTGDGVLIYLWAGSDSSLATGTIAGWNSATSLGGNTAAAGKAAVAITATDKVVNDKYDSVVVTGTSPKTYVLYGRVRGTFGTVSGVRAGAIAYDVDGNTTSAAKWSSASVKIGVDGDRPSSPTTATTSIIPPSGGIARPKIAGGTRTFVFTGGALTAATPKAVHGIGDTIAFKVKLGAAAGNEVFTASNNLRVVADVFGKILPVPVVGGTQDTISLSHVIAAGDYGNLVGRLDANTDTIEVFVVDAAGNRSHYSNSDAASPGGVTSAVTFLLDATAPILDGQVASGDTILPVNNDTITNGTINTTVNMTAGGSLRNDLDPIRYRLAEALDTLFINFDGTTDATLKVVNNSTAAGNIGSADDASLKKATTAGAWVNVNFTSASSASLAASFATVSSAGGTLASFTNTGATGNQVVGKVTTGLQTMTFQGVDLAGNKGPVLTRTNVYVDIDNLKFDKLFPTMAAKVDTIEKNTSKVIFKLSEDADSVLITYHPIAGNGTLDRKRALVGSELTSDLEQTFTLDSLIHKTQYTLQVLGADLAGNYVATKLDTFVYDTTFVVPVIAKFTITSTAISTLAGSTGTKYSPAAGDTLTITIAAKTIANTDAVTYKKAAILKVTNGSGVFISGTGVTPVTGAAGRFNLSADDWAIGARTLKLSPSIVTASKISVSVVDSANALSPYSGVIDTTIATVPAVLDQIKMVAHRNHPVDHTAVDTVGQGDAFWVALTLADKFGNTRTADAAFVEISTSAIGVQVPTNAIPLAAGVGGFWANSNGYSGSLTLNARSISGAGAKADGTTGETGAVTVFVDGNGARVLDDPDELMAQDYMGALGTGDQGGFVLLTFPVSADHGTLSGYRIYREISVDYAADASGALVALSEPTMAMVPWGRVDAVPGVDVMRVVVATLDGDLTAYGVAAERGGLSSKEAFDTAEAVSSPYELMAQTMLKSKEVAQLDPAAPVFATLTPEALAFDATGVVPRLKTVEDVLLSNIRHSVAPARAIDNIPPAPIVNLQVEDTQGDVGGSITVRWAKSADDRLLSTTVANAVGEAKTYTTAGVEGYNVYRRIGDAAWQMVGQVAAGETSFDDATVFNGVRYAYKVEARDADNVTDSSLQKSAMAIRNNIVGADGQRILGLFGADARVDIDDFFIFADHFGMTAGADGFDKAFDLNPNNVIDVADFFVFADNFGREMVGAGKVVPTMAGLNSDARFYLAAGDALPRVGEELSIAVSLEDFVEVRGYGLTVEFDNQLLEFVESRVVDNALGEAELAAPQAFAQGDGKVSIAAFGETVSEGDLGLNLIFRSKQEIESSYIELTSGALQDGSYGLNRITSPVSIRVETRPEVYALEDNYPNPFNPETTIKYQLPEAGQVTLEVYNMLGQVVKTLVDNQFQNAGRYTLQWDATNSNGQNLSSGVYFYRITAGGEFQSHKKMLLLK